MVYKCIVTINADKYRNMCKPFLITPASRLLWFGCVVSAAILFTSQVIIRSVDYFEHETNVNVELIYDSQVQFPAVTLCNQNNFR